MYEAIRNSGIWEKSLLIITYDEHGGFYNHFPPPPAHDPDDGSDTSKWNENDSCSTSRECASRR